MTMRGREPGNDDFEQARSGTIYWTLSLYIEPDRVAGVLRDDESAEPIEPEVFRRAQMRHRPSLALRNAIDPLFNDIADREVQGELQECLLAATDRDADTMDEAGELIRARERIVFQLPPSTRWTTEGVCYEAHPPHLDDPRLMHLRRFWLSHNNGALSYHLSFSHHYGEIFGEDGASRSGYDPSTYYFLSLLQKLAAPKEYVLGEKLLERQLQPEPAYANVFEDGLDLDPLDRISVTREGRAPQRFWPFVRDAFDRDAQALFKRLASALPGGKTKEAGLADALISMVPFVEVPGLKMPKARFMFMFNDERFFDRLMPRGDDGVTSLPRKAMVRDGCYADYQRRIEALSRDAENRRPSVVHLGDPGRPPRPRESADVDFWTWATVRPEYAAALAGGRFAASRAADAPPVVLAPDDTEGLRSAIRGGTCVLLPTPDVGGAPEPVSIPAYEHGRADCLDYLFLSGFNQNIIDFMNQDPSEILDSIDPIYPDSEEQSDEHFFVRYANHRAMITYVPRSRSLEIGNDYIGTCPYAFLIHAMALHNEFLARGHEDRSRARIERITAMTEGREPRASDALALLSIRERLEGPLHEQAETAINKAKLAVYAEYERFRHVNPFRYDTERDVFAKLEALRGTDRKQAAMALAIESLEDHASDLQRRHQAAADRMAASRNTRLDILLGSMGIFGAGQMIYWIGEKAAAWPDNVPKPILFMTGPPIPGRVVTGSNRLGEAIMGGVEVVMALAAFLFMLFLLYVIVTTLKGPPEE